jgi:hypothetical protein
MSLTSWPINSSSRIWNFLAKPSVACNARSVGVHDRSKAVYEGF